MHCFLTQAVHDYYIMTLIPGPVTTVAQVVMATALEVVVAIIPITTMVTIQVMTATAGAAVIKGLARVIEAEEEVVVVVVAEDITPPETNVCVEY